MPRFIQRSVFLTHTLSIEKGARVPSIDSLQRKISTADLVGAILQKFKIVDISVQEPDIEELIKTVYEDNLTLERKLTKPISPDARSD